jgi:hypothetical protein
MYGGVGLINGGVGFGSAAESEFAIVIRQTVYVRSLMAFAPLPTRDSAFVCDLDAFLLANPCACLVRCADVVARKKADRVSMSWPFRLRGVRLQDAQF